MMIFSDGLGVVLSRNPSSLCPLITGVIIVFHKGKLLRSSLTEKLRLRAEPNGISPFLLPPSCSPDEEPNTGEDDRDCSEVMLCKKNLDLNFIIDSNAAKSRYPIYFRTQCILSTATTTVLELEKLQLPSLEAISSSVPADRSSKPTRTTGVLELEKLNLPSLDVHSKSIAADRPWTYIGAVGPPTEANLEATLATVTLLTSEEAVIAAAAAEALALAKAAVKVAKEAARMVSNRTDTTLDCETTEILPEVDNTLSERNQLAHFAERVDSRESNDVRNNVVAVMMCAIISNIAQYITY
ncbi:RNA polymerase sigma factor [Abeliophyllum distichum]|uniref:RNA polymerase sigma factor n=1 Tax=Abeliophyllum distichum TaxID=126358 RepID=A0ABD1PCC3_9LAMI